LLHGVPGGVKGAAIARGFDHDHSYRDAADDPVSLRKQSGRRLAVQRRLGEQHPLPHDFLGQVFVLRRINLGESRRGDRDGSSLRGQRPAVRCCVDPARQSAHDGHSAAGQSAGQTFRLLAAVKRASPRTDDRHRELVARFQRAATVQHRRRVANLGEQPRVAVVAAQNQFHAQLAAPPEFHFRLIAVSRPGDRGRQLRADAVDCLQLADARREDGRR
jgi:hypothetical protein